jgi:pSer/pThr/pTyr-binding forkhead associated (FHA) protein
MLEPGGAIIEVDGPDVLVGRHTEADIRLPMPDVSRRHCRLQFIDGGWQVIDLNSLNGVQVNGEPVLQAPLGEGDRLRIGSFIFTIDLQRRTGTTGSASHIQSILKTLSDNPRRQAS